MKKPLITNPQELSLNKTVEVLKIFNLQPYKIFSLFDRACQCCISENGKLTKYYFDSDFTLWKKTEGGAYSVDYKIPYIINGYYRIILE